MKSRAEIFGENLERILQEKGISRKELMMRLNVSQAALALYIAGKREPPLDKIFKIAEILQISITDLTGDVIYNSTNPTTLSQKIFQQKLERAYSMARDYLDDKLNATKNFDKTGNILIYSPKRKVKNADGILEYQGGYDVIAFKTAEDFVRVIEKSEKIALERGIFFNLAFREVVGIDKTVYRVIDDPQSLKPML